MPKALGGSGASSLESSTGASPWIGPESMRCCGADTAQEMAKLKRRCRGRAAASAKCCPTVANLGQSWPNCDRLARRSTELGPTLAQLWPTSGQMVPRLGRLWDDEAHFRSENRRGTCLGHDLGICLRASLCGETSSRTQFWHLSGCKPPAPHPICRGFPLYLRFSTGTRIGVGTSPEKWR